ncbi:MAG: pyridoxamine 5'-phosphate oxidase family protein [Nitrosopumilus sp.]|nr:pyridoxamine 5'-phosphate oxidase family protein [Nitrosopumilus sp.]
MKIMHASPGIGSALSESQVDKFLTNSKLNLLLGTIDGKGEPNIHPVWYFYENGRMYIETSKTAKKAQNIRNKNIVYFCIDDEKIPYKGVRGKASAIILEEIPKILPIAEQIMVKYTGDLENNVAKFLLDGVKSGSSVLLELEPKYFSTWDHSGAF